MAAGLYSGSSGLALGVGLYYGSTGLGSGASGFERSSMGMWDLTAWDQSFWM